MFFNGIEEKMFKCYRFISLHLNFIEWTEKMNCVWYCVQWKLIVALLLWFIRSLERPKIFPLSWIMTTVAWKFKDEKIICQISLKCFCIWGAIESDRIICLFFSLFLFSLKSVILCRKYKAIYSIWIGQKIEMALFWNKTTNRETSISWNLIY